MMRINGFKNRRRCGNFLCLWTSCLFVCLLLTGCGGRETVLYLNQENAEASQGPGLGKETDASFSSEGPLDGPDRGEVSGQEEKGGSIAVYVCGAVAEPRVVELPEGSRADEAIAGAGGFLPDADESYVNLAARLKDGEKLFIPTREEAASLGREQENQAAGTVNLNTADREALCTLPGIGESRAGDIISYREKNGGFRAIEDIMKVPGIKENAFEKIKEKITVE